MKPCKHETHDETCKTCRLFLYDHRYTDLWRDPIPLNLDSIQVHLINLNRRPDRLAKIHEVWESTGLPQFKRFEAIDGERLPPINEGGAGAEGCRQSHLSILRHALSTGLDRITVFEDDVSFVPNFKERYADFMSRIPNDADAVFLGGQHIEDPTATQIPSLVRCQNTHRTHAYSILNRNYMSHLYKVWSEAPRHIDHVWGEHQKDWQVYAPMVWLCGQSEGKSDINGRDLRERVWQPRRVREAPKVVACEPCKKKEEIQEVAKKLIEEQSITMSHAGDLGDLIAALPHIATLGKGRADLVLHRSSGMVRESWNPEKVEAVKSFFENQPYIYRCRYSENIEGIDLNLWRRKGGGWRHSRNLSDMVAKAFRLPTASRTDGFIFCEPVHAAPVVITRSQRYHGSGFPWKEIMQRWGDRAVFCGTTDEWDAFSREFGELAYFPTPTLLDLAQAIRGASLWIGNQSSPFWLATGMQQRVWLEVSSGHNNCKWERPSAHYANNFPNLSI